MKRWKHKGAHSELIACAWLLNEGYEVFRNVSPHGTIDIVAFKAGEMFKFDVKSTTYLVPRISMKLKEKQMSAGIRRLNVYPDGKCEIIEPNML